MFYLLVLFSLFFNVLKGQSFPVASTKIFNYANSDDTSRIFFTNLSEISVLEDFDPADYPNLKDLGIGMLAEYPANCSCPDLLSIHSVATQKGQLRFQKADLITDDVTDYGFAGYLAPFPGYCNSYQVELIEFYSPILKEYRYDTSNNIYNYYSDFKNQYRPVRVLGFAYYTTTSVWMSGTAPFIKPNLQSPVYKSISVRFEIVRVLSKNGVKSYAIGSSVIQKLIDEEEWELTDSVSSGPLSSQNELELIKSKCGENVLEKCVETKDPETGLYRPMNSVQQNISDKEIVGDCGYFLSSNSGQSCFPQATQFYSYIPKYNNKTVIYGNYNDGEVGNSVGLAYPHIFAFLKL